MRMLVTALATFGVFGLAAASAAAPSISLYPSNVRRGYLVRISGSADGCKVGNTVTIISRAFPHTHEFAGVAAVLAKVRAGGRYSTTTRIPRSTHSGLYGVTARCGGGNLGVLAHLRVRR